MSIILDNVKTDIFSNISLELKKGEKIAIIGENGVGKTTFLRTLLGLIPFEGKIEILSEELENKKDFRAIYSEIGYLFQDSDDSFIAPSVLEELAFSLYNKTGDFEDALQKAEELAKEFNIEHIKDKVPIKLSGGQKRVVAIASLLLHEPKILLLDEPSNHLDNKVAQVVQDKLKKFDGSIVLVAHNIEFAKGIVDKFYELKNNELKEVHI